MPDEKTLGQAAEAVAAIVPVAQVYQDAAQPTVKEVGTVLAGTVRTALAPLRGIIWGFDRISEYLTDALSERLKYVPKERVTTPDPTVAGPALEALRFAAHDQNLRELYANLLATAMDSETARNAHPAFVEILKQLSPDEAKLVELFKGVDSYPIMHARAEFRDRGMGTGGLSLQRNISLLGQKAKCTHLDLVPAFLDNICRLGITDIPAGMHLTSPDAYNEIESIADVMALKKTYEIHPIFSLKLEKRYIYLTQLGRQFLDACVVCHDAKKPASEAK